MARDIAFPTDDYGRRNDGALWQLASSKAVTVEKCGIAFDAKVSLDTWEAVGRQLLAVADSTIWWIADWLVYGEDQFQDRYQEVIQKALLSYQTLRNYARVGRRFDLSRRRDNLSFRLPGERRAGSRDHRGLLKAAISLGKQVLVQLLL